MIKKLNKVSLKNIIKNFYYTNTTLTIFCDSLSADKVKQYIPPECYNKKIKIVTFDNSIPPKVDCGLIVGRAPNSFMDNIDCNDIYRYYFMENDRIVAVKE